MNTKLSLIIIIILTVNYFIFSQISGVADNTKTLNFSHTSIVGSVININKKAIKNIKLELELAPEKELRRELNLAGVRMTDAIQSLKNRVGSGIFAFSKTDENGLYKIKGVPIPGIYYINIKNNADYLPTRIKIQLNQTGNREFKAQNIILISRKSQKNVLPAKAMVEISKSKKYYSEKNLSKAMKHMKAALEIAPEYSEGHFNIAMMYIASKKPNMAIEHLKKSIKLKKDYKSALLNLGNLYVSLKKKDMAIPYFERLLSVKKKELKLDKKDAVLNNNIASYYYLKKNIKKAIIFYEEAIRLNKEIGADTYMYLANSYLFNRDKKNAVKYYNKYIELYPNGKNIKQIKTILKKLNTEKQK